MDLMRNTGLACSKLVYLYHYTQFRQQHHRPLSTSLGDRRTELQSRVKLDEVLDDACRLAGEHPITKWKRLVRRCVDRLTVGACKADCVARLEQLVELVAAHTVDEFKEVRAAESMLGFAHLASSREWHNTAPASWLPALADANGKPDKDAVKDARYVMDVAMYDALRASLHRTRNPPPPFPPPSEVSVGDVRAPVLYYIAGWLLNCIR